MADFSTVALRHSITGQPPNYKRCWARSTVWGFSAYMKATRAQHDVVVKRMAEATAFLTGEGGEDGDGGGFWRRVFGR
ncbi:MAG: hypothetical protein Q9172_007395 [Xanthocarpia lactea]